jgi:hypothetical protein
VMAAAMNRPRFRKTTTEATGAAKSITSATGQV